MIFPFPLLKQQLIFFHPGLQSRKFQSNATFSESGAYTCVHAGGGAVVGRKVSPVSTLTWDLKSRTSMLLAEPFRFDTWGLMGGSGKLQYSLSLEPPKLIIKPLRA